MSASSCDGHLVARVFKGVVEIFNTEAAFKPILKEDGSTKRPFHPTAKQPEKTSISECRGKVGSNQVKGSSKKETPNPSAAKKPAVKDNALKAMASIGPSKKKSGPEPSKPSSACPKSKGTLSSRRAQESLQVELLKRIDRSSLLPLLRASTCGFPEKSRALIWTKLLQLPRNKRKHKKLLQAHPSSITLKEILEVCWPDLKALPSLPLFVRPIATLFSGHPTTEFECAAVLLKDFLLFGDSASSAPTDDILQVIFSSEMFPLLFLKSSGDQSNSEHGAAYSLFPLKEHQRL